MKAARAKIKDASVQGETFSLIGAYAKSVYVYGAYGYRGGEAIYTQLGLTPPESVKRMPLIQLTDIKPYLSKFCRNMPETTYLSMNHTTESLIRTIRFGSRLTR